jgi:hypothetical protein
MTDLRLHGRRSAIFLYVVHHRRKRNDTKRYHDLRDRHGGDHGRNFHLLAVGGPLGHAGAKMGVERFTQDCLFWRGDFPNWAPKRRWHSKPIAAALRIKPPRTPPTHHRIIVIAPASQTERAVKNRNQKRASGAK